MRWPSCGHLFHRVCTRNFLRTDHRCPSCRSAVPHVSHGTSTAGVIPQVNDDGVVSSSQDDRPYQLAEFDMDDYAGHSAYDSSVTHWQLVVDLFRQGVPVTYDMLRNYGELNMGKNGKSTKSPIFNFLINGRILFSVLVEADKKVRGWNTYGRSAHCVSDP